VWWSNDTDLANTATDSRYPGDYLVLEPEPILFDMDSDMPLDRPLKDFTEYVGGKIF